MWNFRMFREGFESLPHRFFSFVLDRTLDKRLWRGYERTLADAVAYPGFQTWWAARKHWHTVQRIELRNAF